MFVLLFLTPVFSKLPYNVIGAIIITGVCQLIEFGVAWHLFKVRMRSTRRTPHSPQPGRLCLRLQRLRMPAADHDNATVTTMPPTTQLPAPHPKTNLRDFLVWLAAFLGTAFLGVEIGLAISIGLALLIVVFESAFAHSAVLGELGNTGVYR
jgi:MFS superfamily sulfate permease-like transporter